MILYTGWVGDFCAVPVCAIECLNGGTCIGPNKCLCKEWYDGPTCALHSKPEPTLWEKNAATVIPVMIVGKMKILHVSFGDLYCKYRVNKELTNQFVFVTGRASYNAKFFCPAAILIGLYFLWRARKLKDHLSRVAYQLEYDKKHKPNAGVKTSHIMTLT